jgi:hypothetical protein
MKAHPDLKRLGLKALNNLVSVKAGILMVACVFVYLGKISEGAWVQVIMVVVGARAANELMTLAKKGPNE